MILSRYKQLLRSVKLSDFLLSKTDLVIHAINWNYRPTTVLDVI